MRRMSHRHGAAMSYTEMANVRGLLNPEEKKTWSLLETTKNEGPVVAHLFGTEPDMFAEAAVKVEQTKRFVAIDLNAGCPARKVVDEGAGAELINDPQRIHDILAAMRKAVQLPITLKTRLGPSPDRVAIFEVLAAAESAGAAALALHGRFSSQKHRGDVNLKIMAKVKERAKIPIIGNGDVHSRYSAWHIFEATGVDAIMIARAAVGNPWIFENLRLMFASRIRPVERPGTHVRPEREIMQIKNALEAHLDLQRAHLQATHEKYGIPTTAEDIDRALVATFQCHLFRYLRGLHGASYVRGKMSELKNLESILETVNGCFEREAVYRETKAEPPPKPTKKKKKKTKKKKKAATPKQEWEWLAASKRAWIVVPKPEKIDTAKPEKASATVKKKLGTIRAIRE